jgi:hypothetical protein
MEVFIIEPDAERYQSLYPASEKDYGIHEMLCGVPIEECWTPFSALALIENGTDTNLPTSDFPSMSASLLPVFSERAIGALKEFLLSNGELLPINTDNGHYFVFNVTTLTDALDFENSKAAHFTDGRIMTMVSYTFHSDRIKQLSIFKAQQLPLNPIFVTNSFVNKARKAGLKGFVFKKIWSDKSLPSGNS